ncbi:protein disulfide isomerase-like 1-4 isoform X2 [Magnolia sinica]|uniref:protein disulfide isomerase-like 1-4 isoform X2 n=1 Tax=Magnolia sinica TaxID=86752 RepID=UPI0026592D28|nr:protein disulfide isomerase-like 1-4 isoform X2 [Magnolia sinica]
MAIPTLIIAISISALLVCHGFCSATPSKKSDELNHEEEEEEDLSFLEEDDAGSPIGGEHSITGEPDPDYLPDGNGEFENFEGLPDFEHGDAYPPPPPEVDDEDVVVLQKGNFSSFIEKNRYVMVEFYASWCGHCQALAPEYAAAATELKGVVVLAKVDATVESELAEKYDVQGLPTVLFFADGVHKPYRQQRNKDAIVTWIKKKTGPGIHNITTIEDAEQILSAESKVVLGFFDSLMGPESEELATASQLDDDVNFYQTSNPHIAKLFHIEPEAKRPALVLLKKDDEKLSFFEGQLTKPAIVDFVLANKLPLVTIFTRESAQMIFENPINKQVLLFATSDASEKVLPIFQEAAKFFKGKLVFVYVQKDNEDIGRPVSDYFGVTGDGPNLLGYEGSNEPKKYKFDGEVTLDSIKAFGEGFVADRLKPFFKSDPIPETNDGDVKIVVGDNFDKIVLDESKDVLLEIYAPWCGHCQAMEPAYNKLAKHLRGIRSLVMAKMDGTRNEHPRALAEGFPTLLFFPADSKSSDPIAVEMDRTAVALYKFIKKHASIPFKLPKPEKAIKSENESVDEAEKSSSRVDRKDEL